MPSRVFWARDLTILCIDGAPPTRESIGAPLVSQPDLRTPAANQEPTMRSSTVEDADAATSDRDDRDENGSGEDAPPSSAVSSKRKAKGCAKQVKNMVLYASRMAALTRDSLSSIDGKWICAFDAPTAPIDEIVGDDDLSLEFINKYIDENPSVSSATVLAMVAATTGVRVAGVASCRFNLSINNLECFSTKKVPAHIADIVYVGPPNHMYHDHPAYAPLTSSPSTGSPFAISEDELRISRSQRQSAARGSAKSAARSSAARSSAKRKAAPKEPTKRRKVTHAPKRSSASAASDDDDHDDDDRASSDGADADKSIGDFEEVSDDGEHGEDEDDDGARAPSKKPPATKRGPQAKKPAAKQTHDDVADDTHKPAAEQSREDVAEDPAGSKTAKTPAAEQKKHEDAPKPSAAAAATKKPVAEQKQREDAPRPAAEQKQQDDAPRPAAPAAPATKKPVAASASASASAVKKPAAAPKPAEKASSATTDGDERDLGKKASTALRKVSMPEHA